MVPISHLVLSVVQSRILLALLTEGSLASAAILKQTVISESSWSKEKAFLLDSDLVSFSKSRELGQKGIIRKTEFALTQKGKYVAQCLLAISCILVDSSRNVSATSSEETSIRKEVSPLHNLSFA